MLQLINSYLKLTKFNKNKFDSKVISDYFDTEVEELVKFIYSDHRLNYDRLYRQEQINNICKVTQDKSENYEQKLVKYVMDNFKLSSIIKCSQNLNPVYADIIKYSNLLGKDNLNKLGNLNIKLEKLKGIPEATLIIDSVGNYYCGSIYDLLFDPVWSMVSYLSEEYYLNEDMINTLFGFKYDSIDNIIRLSKQFKVYAIDIFNIIETNKLKELDNLFQDLNEESRSKWKFIVYDILINGRYKGLLKGTDTEFTVLYTYLNMYKSNGTRFIYEIGGV